MADLKLVGQAQLITIKRLFKKEVGVDIVIYDQEGNIAPDDVSLSSIRTKRPDSSEIKIVGQTLVKNVERFFEKNYGVKIDILNGDGSLADNNSTLGVVRRSYSDKQESNNAIENDSSGAIGTTAGNVKGEDFIVAVRFCMKKSEGGVLPKPSELLDKEKEDFASVCKFYLDYEPEDEDLEIIDCRVIYDGVTTPTRKLEKEISAVGYKVDTESDEIVGYPTPIIVFTLNKKVDPEEFANCCELSSVGVLSTNMDEDDRYFAEDHNGYYAVLDKFELSDVIEDLKYYGIYAGRHFTVSDLTDGVICSEMKEVDEGLTSHLDSTSEIAVIFVLKEEEDDRDLPDPSCLRDDENDNIATICKLMIDIDLGPLDEPDHEGFYEDFELLGFQVVYNGVSSVSESLKQEGIVGYEVNKPDDVIEGYPTPVIVFNANMEIEPDLFLQCVNCTIELLSANMEVDDSYYAEDHSNSSYVISQDKLDVITSLLKEHGAYSGKKYDKTFFENVSCSELNS